jgi:hypothetical protein
MNTSTETCPSLEDLAAFLDGKLSGDERARVVAHLADCPRCYEVFAETARFQLYEEEGTEDPDPPEWVPEELVIAQVQDKMVPFPRRQVFRWVSLIAAVLAVSLAVPSLYSQYYTMPEIRSAQLVNPAVAAKASPKDVFWEEFTKRGSGGGSGLASVPHEVLLGAQAVRLNLSLSHNDSARALNDLAGIHNHIDEIGFLPDQAKGYSEIQTRIAGGQPAGKFLEKAEQIEASLTVEEDPYVAFGKWLEAGRLSALAENPDFFKAPEKRKFLRAFLHHELENLDPEVATTLEDLQETLAKDSLPYKDLQGRFEKILTYYQEQSTAP